MKICLIAGDVSPAIDAKVRKVNRELWQKCKKKPALRIARFRTHHKADGRAGFLLQKHLISSHQT